MVAGWLSEFWAISTKALKPYLPRVDMFIVLPFYIYAK
jgi:hypothetical protein